MCLDAIVLIHLIVVIDKRWTRLWCHVPGAVAEGARHSHDNAANRARLVWRNIGSQAV